MATIGRDFVIERRGEDGVWTVDPTTPDRFPDARFSISPGMSQECRELEMPPGMTPANYRFRKSVALAAGRARQFTAHFQVPGVRVVPPPPREDGSGIPHPPTFDEIKQFREEHGLDLDIKGDARAIELRIWRLLYDWGTGESVARESRERWGVPLRQADVDELEYRIWFMAHDLPQIDAWARANFPGTFTGVLADERSGGLLRVGFSADQEASIAALKAGAGLLAPDRVALF